MSERNRWLKWGPNKPQIINESPGRAPTKPTKHSFDGFVGPIPENPHIIRDSGPAHPAYAKDCPYDLPRGVKLIRYTRKPPPVAVTVCSVVTNPEAFIRHALAELDARLHRPVQIKADDSVFELLSKLADCGLEVRVEWTPEKQIINDSLEAEPSKPSEGLESHPANVPGAEIADEDLPI